MRTALVIALAALLAAGCRSAQPKTAAGPLAPRPVEPVETAEADAAPKGEAPAPGNGDLKVKIIKDDADEARSFEPALPPAARNAADRPAESLLDEKRIAVFDFKETPMVEVLKVFTVLTDCNVVASKGVMNLQITMFLKDVTPRVALSTMCKLYNLWFVENENVIRIITAEEYGKELIVRRDESAVVITLRYASALGVADMVAKLMKDCVVYEEPEEFASYGHVGTEEGAGSTRGSGGTSGGYRTSTTYERTTLGTGAGAAPSTTGIEKGLTAAKIEALEKTAPEGLKEGVLEGEIKDIKSERPLVYMSVFPRNNALIIRSVDSRLLKQIGELVSSLDTATSQVLLEVKILEVTLRDDFNSMFDIAFHGSDHPIGQPGVFKHSGALGGFDDLNDPTFRYEFVDKNISIALQFLQRENRLRQIATPLLLCANNAPGKFFVGEERPITVNWEYEIRDIVNVAGGGGSRETTRPVVQYREVGTKITISPSINEDGTVTMRLLTDMSSVKPGGAFVAIVDQLGNVRQLPIDTVLTSNVESVVVAKDSSTLALGGLIRETTSQSVLKVPILGDIPLIKPLFQRRETYKEKTEIVILIVPRIMLSPAAAEGVSSSTVTEISDHPFVKYGKGHLIHVDDEKNKLRNDASIPER